MELLIIRHGLPIRVEGLGGPADPGLAPEGVAQAEALTARWAPQVDAVVSSPMRRARETAAPLADALAVEVAVDDDLAEMDRHLPYYVPLEELRATEDPRWEEAVRFWVSDEGKAERAGFRARVVAAVERVVAARAGDRVAVVCHGGVINAYAAHVIDLPEALFFEPTYTSVSRFACSSRGHRTLVSLNETGHLHAERAPTG